MNLVIISTIIFFYLNKFYGQIFTSEFFATIISILSLLSLYFYPCNLDIIYDPNSEYINLFNITIGYFIYDLYICLYTKETMQFIFHGFIGILFAIISSFGYFANQGLFFLMYEFSTIFIHKAKNPSYSDIWKILFILTFFIFRIIIGSYVSFKCLNLLSNIDNIWLQNNLINYNPSYDSSYFGFIYLIIIFIILLLCLNYFWFYKIIRRVIKHTNKNK